MSKVLVVGRGAREYALCSLFREYQHQAICVPGSDGISHVARTYPLIGQNAIDLIVGVAIAESVDLVVVGPEEPLRQGIADACLRQGVPVFGPTAAGSRLEWSKIFCMHFLKRAGVPIPRYWTFTDAGEACQFAKSYSDPCVIKADGLMQGKGVVVARRIQEATSAIAHFAQSGGSPLIQEFLEGDECSFQVITDGRAAWPLPPATDNKYFNGGMSGGMGGYARKPLTALVEGQVMDAIVQPTLSQLRSEGIGFCGVLYFGLMLSADGPKVLEINTRLGSPECEIVAPLWLTDPFEVMSAASRSELSNSEPRWDNAKAVGVVLAAQGYPHEGKVRTGDVITGLSEAFRLSNVSILPGGIVQLNARDWATAGGRVLTVVGTGQTFRHAHHAAYETVGKINFAGKQFLSGIGQGLD